jgi:hypothetical protein
MGAWREKAVASTTPAPKMRRAREGVKRAILAWNELCVCVCVFMSVYVC